MSEDRAPASAPNLAAKAIAYGVIAAAFAFVGLLGWAVVRVVDFLTAAH